MRVGMLPTSNEAQPTKNKEKILIIPTGFRKASRT
jgi:hypothetical protein